MILHLPSHRSRAMKTIASVIFGMLLSSSFAFPQDSKAQPASIGATAGTAGKVDSDPAALRPALTPSAEHPHRFFDAKNAFAVGAFAIGLAGDSWSTQRALAYPGVREANPLARPFVSSRTGEAVYSGGSLGLMLGGMYLAHKTHHHKLERVVPWAMAGWEGFLTGWNLHQISRRR
jgi:hypothetical protein